MSKMADTVMKKSNEAEKNFEKQLLRQAEERDKKAEREEKRKKDQARQRDIDIKKILDQQLKEKQDFKNREMIQNKNFVAQVIANDERDKADQKEK
jgi:hypothetical protein